MFSTFPFGLYLEKDSNFQTCNLALSYHLLYSYFRLLHAISSRILSPWLLANNFRVLCFYDVLFFEYHRGFDYNFIEWCGLGSIVLYLVHAPVASVVRIALFKLGINSLRMQIAWQLSISIAVSLLVLWLANQNKFMNFFFRSTKYLFANKFGKKVS